MSGTGKMAIVCECGARGWVDPGRAAGRRVCCPRCQRVVQPAPLSPPLAVARPVARPVPVGVAAGLELLPEEPRLELLAAPEPAPVPMPECDPRERPRRKRRRRSPSGGRAEVATGRRDVAQEAHLRAIAFWPALGGGFGLLMTFGFLALALVGGGLSSLAVAALSALVVGGASALNLGVGLSLWTYRAWARWVLVAVYGLGVLACLLTLIDHAPGSVKFVALLQLLWVGAIEATLLSPHTARVCSPEYRRLVARTPDTTVPFWLSPFFYVPLLLAGLSLAMLLLLSGGAFVMALR